MGVFSSPFFKPSSSLEKVYNQACENIMIDPRNRETAECDHKLTSEAVILLVSVK